MKKEQLKLILDMNKKAINNLDKKTGLCLTINGFGLTAVSIIAHLINKQSMIVLITLLSSSILLFITSFFPIFWNPKEKNRENPLYLPKIWKMDKLTYLQNDISIEDYESQIKRVSMILKFKYIFFYLGISVLIISIIALVIVFLII